MLLAFDTTGDACSAVLYAQGRVLAARSHPMRRGHAEALLPMIADLADEAGQPLADVDRIAVATGPGSFTGVRVGIAAARGLALALNVPAAGFSTLETLAAAAAQEAETVPPAVVAAISARGGQLYAQAFTGGLAPLEPPALLDGRTAEARYADLHGLAVGSAAEMLAQAVPGLTALAPRVSLAEALARHAAAAGEARWGQAPAPLYLRPADAKPPAQAPLARKG